MLIRCCDCMYWREGQDHTIGECHRHAPRPSTHGPVDIYWPPATYKDGCGDGQLIELTPPEGCFDGMSTMGKAVGDLVRSAGKHWCDVCNKPHQITPDCDGPDEGRDAPNPELKND